MKYQIKITVDYDNGNDSYETSASLCHCLPAEVMALSLLAFAVRDKLEEYFSEKEINKYYQYMLIDRYDAVSPRLHLAREIERRQKDVDFIKEKEE